MIGRHILPLGMLFLAACTSAPPGSVISARDGCAVHNPNPRSGETITWSGDCRNGFAHGAGAIAWFLDGVPNGRYEGTIRDGRIEGEGTAYYPSGNHYTGEFRDGLPHGNGTFHFADGRRFTAVWRAGHPDANAPRHPTGHTQ